MAGLTIPVVITVYGDRSFTFVLPSTPPAGRGSAQEGSGHRQRLRHPEQGKAGQGGREKQVREIATQRMPDLKRLHGGCSGEEHQGHGAVHGIEVVA